MAEIIINDISSDNLINYLDYQSGILITGNVVDIALGEELELTLNSKNKISKVGYLYDGTTLSNDETYFEFYIPQTAILDTDISVSELQNYNSYIVLVSHASSSTVQETRIFINISGTILSENDFLNGIDFDYNGNEITYRGIIRNGDEIDANIVNAAPIQNRRDLLLLDEKIGNVQNIVDVTSETYDITADNDLESPNLNLTNALSQLRVDIGNKKMLLTEDKSSMVTSINELKRNMYRPENAVNLVADYDFNINGNYITKGSKVTFDSVALEIPNSASNRIYETLRDSSNVETTSTTYNKFLLGSGTFNVKGYKVNNTSSFALYFPDTMEDNQVDRHERVLELTKTLQRYDIVEGSDYFNVIEVDGTKVYGIYDIVEVRGQRQNLVGFDLSIINDINDLRIALQNHFLDEIGEGNVDFTSIDTVTFADMTVVEVLEEIANNGTYYVAPGSVTVVGTFSGNELTEYVNLNENKETIEVMSGIFVGPNGFEGDVWASYNRITPRYDIIYVEMINSNYNALSYKDTITYKIGELVKYNNVTWRCIVESTNNEPTDESTYWENLGFIQENVTIKPRFIYKEGYNNGDGYPVIPRVEDSEYLTLCTILNVYGKDPYVENVAPKAYKMENIQDFEKSLYDGLYNLARLSTIQDLSSTEANLTRNLYVDPFFDNDLRDRYLESAHSVDSKSMFISGGVLTNSVTFKSLTFDADTVHQFTQFDSVKGDLLIDQPNYSKSILINKYQVIEPPKADITVSNRVFEWIMNDEPTDYVPDFISDDVRYVSNDFRGSQWVLSQLASQTWTNETSRTVYSDYQVRDYTGDYIDVDEYTVNITAPKYSFNGREMLRIVLDGMVLFDDTTSTVHKSNDDGSVDISITLGGDVVPMKVNSEVTRKLTIEGIGVEGSNDVTYVSGARGVVTLIQSPVQRFRTGYTEIRITDNRPVFNDMGGDGGGDPLSQTFILEDESAVIHGVEVMFDAIDADYSVADSDKVVNQTSFRNITELSSFYYDGQNYTNTSNGDGTYTLPSGFGVLPEDVTVVLCGMTAGYPDWEKKKATGTITKGTIIKQGTLTASVTPGWTEVEFFPKVTIDRDEPHAFYITSPYETYGRLEYQNGDWVTGVISQGGIRLKLRSIDLGQRYPNPRPVGSAGTLNTQQQYINGVLLSSSNSFTWTAHQEEDLAFRIWDCSFIPSDKIVSYHSQEDIPLDDITDIIFRTYTEEPGETYVDFKLWWNGIHNMSLINGEHKILSSNIDINSPTLNGTLKTLEPQDSNGHVKNSPMTSREATILFGTVDPVSVYCTKNIDLTLNGGSFVETKNLIAYLDIINYDPSRVTVYYTTDSTITSGSWNVMPLDTNYNGPEIEKRFIVEDVDITNRLRVKIVVTTNIGTSEVGTRLTFDNLRIFANDYIV